MPMNDQFDWDKAVNQWQQHHPDLPDSTRNMAWQLWRMRLILALDVIAFLVLLAFTWFVFNNDPRTSIKVWFSLASVLTLVGIFFDFYLRRDLWQQPESTKSMLQLLIKRAQAGVSLASFSIVYLSIFLLALLGWGGYILSHPAEGFNDGALNTVGLAVGFVFLCIVFSFGYRRRKRMEVKAAEQTYREFIGS